MKKLITIILAASMLLTTAVLFSSCGKEEDTLVMATNAAFPPYEYKDGDNYVGIDVEIAEKIAEKLGKKLEIVDIDFGAIITGVQTGKYDIGMAGMTVTDERLEKVNFSNTYANAKQVVIVKQGSGYASIDDFYVLDAEGNYTATKEGVTIGVQQDTTGDIYCSDTVENWGFGEENVVRYKTGADAVAALVAGKLTAVVIDNEPAKSFVNANEGIEILATEYANEDYAICIAKENTELLDAINKALSELTADGTVAGIVNKYIPSDEK